MEDTIPEENKIKKENPKVDLDTSGPEVDVAIPEEKTEEVIETTEEETEKLPKPTGWRILVLPFRMDEKTKGGILMGAETIDRQQVASQCGNVLAMGDSC